MEEWLCVGHHVEEGWSSTKHPERLDGRSGDGVRRRKEGDGGTGVVVMDCVGEGGDWDLVRLAIGMNMGVLEKCWIEGKR